MKEESKVLEEHLGPKCDTYEKGCITCEIWEAFESATENAKREGYEKGHADALRTLPVYETDNTN